MKIAQVNLVGKAMFNVSKASLPLVQLGTDQAALLDKSDHLLLHRSPDSDAKSTKHESHFSPASQIVPLVFKHLLPACTQY